MSKLETFRSDYGSMSTRFTFENGISLSMAHGHGAYCSNRYNTPDEGGAMPATDDVEIAVWRDNGRLLQLSEYDQVIGHVPFDACLSLAICLRSMRKCCDDSEIVDLVKKEINQWNR
jgi:hypothetical protein